MIAGMCETIDLISALSNWLRSIDKRGNSILKVALVISYSVKN